MMVLFSTRVIPEGAEVTVNFGIEWLKEKGSCDCGLDECQLKGQGTPKKGQGTPKKGQGTPIKNQTTPKKHQGTPKKK